MGNDFSVLNKIQQQKISKMLHGSDKVTPGGSTFVMEILVQCLYSLLPFRVPFLRIKEKDHECNGGKCVFCPLQMVFTNIEFDCSKELNLKELDQKMFVMKSSGKGKQLKITESVQDAGEGFSLLLKKLKKNVDVRTFDMTINQQYICGKCGYSDEPMVYQTSEWNVSGNLLLKYCEENEEDFKKGWTFEEMVRKISDGEFKTCPNCKKVADLLDGEEFCEKKLECRKYVIALPFVLVLGINWSPQELQNNIFKLKKTKMRMKRIVDSLTPIILPDEMFRMFESNVNIAARLIGMICFSKGNYVCYHWVRKYWYFVSMSQKESCSLGKQFKIVKSHMMKNFCYPNLLFFELVRRKHDILKVGNIVNQ